MALSETSCTIDFKRFHNYLQGTCIIKTTIYKADCRLYKFFFVSYNHPGICKISFNGHFLTGATDKLVVSPSDS